MRKTAIFLLLALFTASLSMAGDQSQKVPDKKENTVDTTKITWMPYDEGIALARENGKKILVNFTTTWCGYCKKMNREVFSSPDAIKLINEKFVPIKVDGDSKNELDIDGYKITERNLTKAEYKVTGYPTYWLLTSETERLAPIKGYRPKDTFLDMLSYISEDAYKSMTFDEYLAKGGRHASGQ
jgi:thioredoxin-related protein